MLRLDDTTFNSPTRAIMQPAPARYMADVDAWFDEPVFDAIDMPMPETVLKHLKRQEARKTVATTLDLNPAIESMPADAQKKYGAKVKALQDGIAANR
jgi:hypothetical protein